MCGRDFNILPFCPVCLNDQYVCQTAQRFITFGRDATDFSIFAGNTYCQDPLPLQPLCKISKKISGRAILAFCIPLHKVLCRLPHMCCRCDNDLLSKQRQFLCQSVTGRRLSSRPDNRNNLISARQNPDCIAKAAKKNRISLLDFPHICMLTHFAFRCIVHVFQLLPGCRFSEKGILQMLLHHLFPSNIPRQ